MNRAIKQSISSGGNLRASSSKTDNFRNNQNNIKKIANNLVPDNYYFRNNNYINIKFDKSNNFNSTTNKHSENKKYNYNFNEPQSQSRSKQNMNNISTYINGINDINAEIRELSKSIEKSDDVIKKLEEGNKNLNELNKRNINSNLNLPLNKKNKELFN